MARHYGKNHHVYFDRYFTGVNLMEFPLQNNTYSCGMVMTNRKNLPNEAKSKSLKRGDIVFYEKQDTGMPIFCDKLNIIRIKVLY